MSEQIQEEEFSSDEEFDDGDEGTDSDTDIDAKVAEDDVFDIEFFKCYSALKKKDEKIYDKNVKFFQEDAVSDSEPEKEEGKESLLKPAYMTERKAPKMTLLDHQLNLKDEEIEEPDELRRKSKIDLNEPVSKSFYEKELEEIKKSIEEVNENIDSDSDDDLLVVKDSGSAIASRSKSKGRINEMLNKLEDEEDEEVEHLKQLWTDPTKLTDDEKFLRDYILNKRYIASKVDEQHNNLSGHFSKNMEELSDVDDEDTATQGDETKSKYEVVDHSEEKDFDKIARIPRNSTKTIRDLVEKRVKKEKRSKKLEQEKKKKKALANADFEDILGDVPIRFQYRETEPNDYGLSAEELLMATDEELEKWVSLKNAIAYKSKEEELREKSKFDQKRNDINLKKEIFKSIYGEAGEKSETSQPPAEDKPIRTSKRKMDTNSESCDNNTQQHQDEPKKKAKVDDTDEQLKRNKKKKYKRRGLNHKKFSKTGVAPDRLLAYGLSKTKYKKSKML